MFKLTTRMIRLQGKTFSQIKAFDAVKLSTASEVQSNLAKEGLGDWSYDAKSESITRKFQFDNFQQAMCFMNSIAVFADQIDHHPEWFNVYNNLNVNLSTHTCNGVSLKDLYLARYFDCVLQKIEGKALNGYWDIVEIDEKSLLAD